MEHLLELMERVWTVQRPGTGNPLHAVYGSDARHIWAAGYFATVLHWQQQD